MSVSIILTTTINVQWKKIFLLQTNKEERLNIYLKSIREWLKNTNFNIILVENTGYKYEELSEELDMYKDRFEIITFNEQDVPEAEYLLNNNSKGDSELFSIYYAFKNSQIIKNSNSQFIIKITGRFYIPELENYLLNYDLNNYDAIMQNNKDRCELVGTHVNNFDTIFSREYDDKDKTFRGHVEAMYNYRRSKYEKVIQCKEFNIEPTACGGSSHKCTCI